MRMENRNGKYQDGEQATPTIAILGAGFSGLGMAIRLREEGIETFTIYEKADEVGGTWRENTYPGVACDVPSHLYSFSFEPNPNWSRRFSAGDEIWAYSRRCAEKYDLYRSIQFGKTVSAITHDGVKWCVKFLDGATIKADYVVSGLGGLHEPNIPDIEGLQSFAGPVFHTAEWRHDVDLTGKRVAIIGSAASAVQVIPEIVDKVARLDVYQRTPNWVMPRQSYAYPNWLKSLFAKIPKLARLYRGMYFTLMEARFASFNKHDNAIKRYVRRVFTKHLNAQVSDPALRVKLTPDYPIGCKRVLISDDYLASIQKENVDLLTDPIDEITPSGLRTKDGHDHPVDVVILATGFKPFNILSTIEVSGPTGRSLSDAWKDGIAAHRSVAVSGFPNFFMLLGPNSALGHNSVLLMIEAQVNYIIKLMGQARALGARFVDAKPDEADKYNQAIQEDLKERVWAANCGAWYVDQNGHNYTLYPHAVRRYLRDMKMPIQDEYVFETNSSPKSGIQLSNRGAG